MNRIEKDPRHDNITFFDTIETEYRQFNWWATEYQNLSDSLNGKEFLERVMKHVANVKSDSIKAAFIGFAALSSRRRLQS